MKGWQQGAANACHTTFQNEFHSCLDPVGQALLKNERGPHASRPFTTPRRPTYECHLFRISLFRSLRLPIPLTASHCRCRRALNPYGDHRATPNPGFYGAGPLERATARMCREAGTRVTPDRPQHRPFHPSRWPPHRGDHKRPHQMGWHATSNRHNPGLTSYTGRATQTRWAICRGRGRNGPTRNSSRYRLVVHELVPKGGFEAMLLELRGCPCSFSDGWRRFLAFELVEEGGCLLRGLSAQNL